MVSGVETELLANEDVEGRLRVAHIRDRDVGPPYGAANAIFF